MMLNKCCLGDLRVAMIRSWMGGRSQADSEKGGHCRAEGEGMVQEHNSERAQGISRGPWET